MSSLSRRKGAAFQAELAKRWRDAGLFPDARSTQGEQKCRREDKPADIEGTPYAVEAKHRRSCRPLQALEQSEAEAEARADWRDAIAVVKPHGAAMEDAVVVMRLSSFETLVSDALCLRERYPWEAKGNQAQSEVLPSWIGNNCERGECGGSCPSCVEAREAAE